MNTAARIGWTVFIVATLYVCYFSHLGAIGFVGPDEPRYAWIARDMVETGDWVTPRLYGKPWFEKPPLFYWGAALCFKLFGVSEAAARLPSAISALLATLALAWLALRLYGADTARWLLLLLPTTVGMIGFSHAAATDMPFSGMLTIAMVAAAVVLGLVPRRAVPSSSSSSATSSTLFASMLFGFFLGLAVLAKGPAGIILSGGAIFFWALFTKRWRDAIRLLHPAAIAAFCLASLPWYILCARRNPDFFRVFIIEHNFKRFLTPEFQHIQPFWFYFAVLFVGSFPWTLLLIQNPKHLRTFWSRKEIPVDWCFLWCWFLLPVLFFSFSRSKLPGYVLPSFHPLFALLSKQLADLIRNKQITRVKFGMGLVAGYSSLLALFASIEAWLLFRKSVPSSLIHFSATIALAGFIVTFLFALRNNPAASMVSGVVSTLGLVVVLNLFGAPWLDPQMSARVMGTIRIPHDTLGENLCTFGLKRSWQIGLNFYQRKELPACKLDSKESLLAYADVDALQRLNSACIPFHVMDRRSANALLLLIRPGNSAARTPGGGKPK